MQNNNAKSKADLKYRSYHFAVDLIRFIDILHREDWSIEIIAKQLLRSATSIGANIIEAQAGSSKKDFVNFFSYALKSANETKFWLCLLRDSGKAKTQNITLLLQEAVEISNMLASSILTLKGKRKL